MNETYERIAELLISEAERKIHEASSKRAKRKRREARGKDIARRGKKAHKYKEEYDKWKAGKPSKLGTPESLEQAKKDLESSGELEAKAASRAGRVGSMKYTPR